MTGSGKLSDQVTPSVLIWTGVFVGNCYLVTKNPELAVGVRYNRVIDLSTSPSKVKEKDRCLARSFATFGISQPEEHTVAGQRLVLTGLPCCDLKKPNTYRSKFTQTREGGQAFTFLGKSSLQIWIILQRPRGRIERTALLPTKSVWLVPRLHGV